MTDEEKVINMLRTYKKQNNDGMNMILLQKYTGLTTYLIKRTCKKLKERNIVYIDVMADNGTTKYKISLV